VPATRIALTALVSHILSESILFQEDPHEPTLWLAALPNMRRAAGAESPDGAPLTDEGDSVVGFLDDCVQRCLKTPYRYIEEMHMLPNTGTDRGELWDDRPDAYPSPLLMAVVEQLGRKISSGQLSPSDVLALVSFVRMLTFRLSTKQQRLKFLHTVAEKIDALLHRGQLFPQHPVVTEAIRREVSIMYCCLGRDQKKKPSQLVSAGTSIKDFLKRVEILPIREYFFPPQSLLDPHLTPYRHIFAAESAAARIISAFELVDWLRLVNNPLSFGDIRQLVSIVERYHKPALKELSEHLHPAHGLLWEAFDIESRFPQIRAEYVTFISSFPLF